ncbi:MAG: hypothetical protein ACF8R7_08735 [Phycisphaerales bacterium JB039]
MASALPILAAAILAGAGYQPEQPGEIRRLSPGFEDFSPVALSRRLEPVDNRVTLFAEDVYEGVRTDRFGASERVYMRMYGGMTVIFPQSTYAPSVWGQAPTIPPGAIFYLGSPEEALGETARAAPASSAAPLASASGALRLSLRQDLAAGGGPAPSAGAAPATPGADESDQPSIFSSEMYRQRRMATLLAQAARAELAGN